MNPPGTFWYFAGAEFGAGLLVFIVRPSDMHWALFTTLLVIGLFLAGYLGHQYQQRVESSFAKLRDAFAQDMERQRQRYDEHLAVLRGTIDEDNRRFLLRYHQSTDEQP